MADDDFSVPSMARSMASGLVDAAGSHHGALLIGEIFPPRDTPPVYLDAVYVQITKIVHQALTPDDAAAISGALNGVPWWVKDTYGPLKADPSSTPAILHEAVQPFVDTIVSGVIMPLMTVGPPGLSIFLLAACAHLALVQELAYTDPAHQTNRGMDSPFAASVRQYAKEYHDFIGTTWPEIKTARTNMVSEWWTPTVAKPHRHSQPAPLSLGHVSWEDTLDGTSGGVSYEADDPDGTMATAVAKAQITAHVTLVLAALAAALGDPDTIAANFLQLVSWPLPVASPKILSLSASGGGSINYDQGFQQKVWSYSLSWSTTGGTASLDGGVGTVAASGSLSFSQRSSPPVLPSTLTVTGPYDKAVSQQINW